MFATVILAALNFFLMRLVVILPYTIIFILYDEIYHHLKDLYDSVNHSFRDDQGLMCLNDL